MRPAGIPGKFKCQSITLNTSYWLGRGELCFAVGKKEELWLKKGSWWSVWKKCPQTVGLREVGQVDLSRSTEGWIILSGTPGGLSHWLFLFSLDQSQPSDNQSWAWLMTKASIAWLPILINCCLCSHQLYVGCLSPGVVANKKGESQQQHGMLGRVNSDLGKKSKNS